MINRLKDILRAELSEKMHDLGMFRDSIEDMEINEILEKLKKQYGADAAKNGPKGQHGHQYGGGQHKYRQSGGQGPYTDPNKEKERAYYQNLELPYGAPFADIKKSYRRLMKIYHPDLYHNDSEKFEMAQQVSSQLNEAYVYFEQKFGK